MPSDISEGRAESVGLRSRLLKNRLLFRQIIASMKKILLLTVLAVMNLSAAGSTREDLWKKVDEAVAKGLPQTAIANLEPIIGSALKDKSYAEAAKALVQKISLEGNIQGNKPEERITRLEAVIAKAPAPMVPLLNTLLAHYYWQYYQQNRWRFLQRTTTAEAPGKDFTAWDLPRLFAAIDAQFQTALRPEAILRKTPVSDWGPLLLKGTMPDSYRPTLYDFIAHEALQFYTSGEQTAAKPQDAFELAVTGPALGTASEFLQWQAPDDNLPSTQAIRLFQSLLQFHKEDPLPRTAFAAVDLERLTWAWNTAFGEDKNSRYRAALERFIKEYADFEISAQAMERLGRLLQQEQDLVTARGIAFRGVTLFPESPGGKLCQNLVTEIEQESSSITTERVWNAPWPTITVRYRNVSAVHFRAIPYDWKTFLEKGHNRPESLNPTEKREVLGKPPVLKWSENLPPTTDYKERTFATKAPSSLEPGFYFIAASHDPQFGETDNVVSLADVWVSDLALVTRQRNGKLEGLVLQAGSGEPIKRANILVWHLDQNGNRIPDPTLTTDQDGFFQMHSKQNRGYLFLAQHEGHELASYRDLGRYGWDVPPSPSPTSQTVFFTDRAIYRPGQIIQFKGICLRVDQSKDNYETLKGESLTVVFQDANGKEIERQKVRANDFGSFSGSFTAPRDRLMGQMSILVQESRAQGNIHFRVEEYKRPKFEVTLDAPTTAPKLNTKVTLTGRAISYSGAAVDGATVKYRVVRRVQMPWWWGWWNRPSPPSGESQEIAHGVAATGADGSFHIEFTAKPDPKVPEEDDPKFHYAITADVTDSAGETRSDNRNLRVGYTALEATLSLASAWCTTREPVGIDIRTTSLDNEPQVAEGTLKIYELIAPSVVQRLPIGGEDSDLDGSPDEDLSNPNNWRLGAVVAEKGFTTDTNGSMQLAFTLPVGAYRALVETQDRFDKRVTAGLPLQVLSPEASSLGIKVPHLLASPNWSNLQPGDTFMALWGTGYEAGRAFIEIEHRHQMLERYWTKPGQTQQQIRLAVTETLRGGFTLHVTQVRENRSFLSSSRIEIPWKNKQFDLSWGHFVSKLQPGQKETWTLAIRPALPGSSAEKMAAEMVASLYDASLDAFAPQHWANQFNVFRTDYSTMQFHFANLPKGFDYAFGRWNRGWINVPITYRSFPEDLVGSFWGYQRMRTRKGIYRDGTINSAMSPVPSSAPAMLGAALAETPMESVAAGQRPFSLTLPNRMTSPRSKPAELPCYLRRDLTFPRFPSAKT